MACAISRFFQFSVQFDVFLLGQFALAQKIGILLFAHGHGFDAALIAFMASVTRFNLLV